MNWTDIRVLYLRELKSALRERSIVINSILIPIVLYPLMFWLIYTGITFVSGQTAELDSHVMFVNFPAGHPDLRKDFDTDKRIKVVDSRDPQADLRLGALDALVEFTDDSGNNFHARISYDESRDRSNQARIRIEQKITQYRQRFLQLAAAHLGVSREQFQTFWIDSQNVSTNRQMGQFILGLLLPMMLVIMMALGGFYPAVDATAGERENSTWETIMTAGTARSNIVVAKYLYVATMCASAAMLNVTAMMFSMRTLLAPVGRAIGPLSFEIPLSAVPVIALGVALMSLFVAAGMMILASFARTFREGQTMVSPFYLTVIIPVMFTQSPGAEFTTRLALIPVVNVVMMFREAITGIYHWPLIGLTVVVETVSVIVALKIATTILSNEDIVTGSYHGSFMKFVKERWIPRTRQPE
jgi:sodium transport system permease protein